MAKYTFSNTPTGIASANAVAGPKHIWYDQNAIRVFTFDDMPTQPSVDADLVHLRTYAKLASLKNMTPAQVSTWVDGNVTNLAQAQDAIKTLAIAVGYLIRHVV